MISSWRRRRAVHHATKNELCKGNSNPDPDITIPTHFRCPISLGLMKDPVTMSTGITYDRESIEKWIESGNQTCPLTNQLLQSFDQIPNHALRKMIQDWCVENRSNGIERIPTPRIPVTHHEVSEISSRIMAANQRGDAKTCQDLVGKIKRWAKESEKNKQCMVENGLGFVLSDSFESFSSISIQKHEILLMEILWALNWMFPLGLEGQSKLCSISSLRCMACFLKSEDLFTRKSTVLALKELLSADQLNVNVLQEIETFTEELVKIVKIPICPTTTKAALTVIYYMISSLQTSEKIRKRFVDMGMIELILEIILVDSEKSICEKGLRVLDGLCGCDEGRERAKNNALIMPFLVKKIAILSNVATESLVSILWKLCKNDNGVFLIEAVQLGVFQKLLVVLQVGCSERTKEKATELLKLLNRYKDRFDSSDSSMDFKYLKRPY